MDPAFSNPTSWRVVELNIQRREPDFIDHRESDPFVLGVVIAGLVVLRGLDTFDQIAVMRLEVAYQSFGGRNDGARLKVDRKGRVEAVVDIEGENN